MPMPAGPPGVSDMPPGPPPLAGQGQAASGSPPYPGQASYGTPSGQTAYGTPYGPPPYSGPPARGELSGFAIAGFVLGLLGFLILTAILSVIFGIVALVKIRDNPQQRGKGLAIAGLAVSGLWLVLLVIVIVAAAVSPPTPQRSGTGQVTQPGTTDVSSLRTGDCFQYPGARIIITKVTVVPCTQAHNAQVYAEFPATGSSYPGPAALHRQSAAGCRARLAGNVNESLVTQTMTGQFLYPEPGSWASGERTIRCLIVDSSADLTTSVLATHPAG
jgi:Domain of unknown function (DUF4190)/Septum formation